MSVCVLVYVCVGRHERDGEILRRRGNGARAHEPASMEGWFARALYVRGDSSVG